MQKRIQYLDLLRIIACFMVVVIHTASMRWHLLDPKSFEWNVLNVYDSMVRSAVPLFFMISGVLFLGKSELQMKTMLRKHVLPMFLAYIFWFLVSILANATPLHLWYLPEIICIYLIMPVLHALVNYEDGRYVKYYLALFFVLGVVKTTIAAIPVCTNIVEAATALFPVELVGYSGYAVLGYELNKTVRPSRKLLVAGFAISVIATAFITRTLSLSMGKPCEGFYHYISLFSFVEACCIFLLMKDMNVSGDKWEKIITTISGCTFGIYLVHIIVMNCLETWAGLHCLTYSPVIWVPIYAFIVFFISLMLTYIGRQFKRIFKKRRG